MAAQAVALPILALMLTCFPVGGQFNPGTKAQVLTGPKVSLLGWGRLVS